MGLPTLCPALFTGFLALFGYVVAVPLDTQEALSRARWLGTWTTMPQLCETWNIPPAPFTQNNSVFYNATLRQSLKISLPGPLLYCDYAQAMHLGRPLSH